MLGLIRRLARLRGPAGALVVAVGFGAFTGLVAAHLVLALWTYRDAARRDRRAPGRWALVVLVGGLVTFVPYLLLQRATDWSAESRGAGAVRSAVGRARGSGGRGRPESGDGDGPAAGEGDEQARPDEPGGARGRAGAAARNAVGAATGAARRRGTARAGDAVEGRRGGSLAVVAAHVGWKAARLGARGARWAGERAVARMNNR